MIGMLRKNESEGESKQIRMHLISGLTRASFFAALVFFIFTCVFGVEVIESNDMYPAVRAGDLVLYYRLGSIRRQDVVVYERGGSSCIGRVQAMEGDIIGVTETGEMTINGNVQPVQKRMGLFYRTYIRNRLEDYPLMLKKDEYFILGDERESAADSRVSGAGKRREIKGNVFMTIRRRAI